MNTKHILTALLLLSFSLPAFSQAADISVRILKAEDERRYDGVLENLLKNANPAIRARAALAAGRIGDERAVAALAGLLAADREVNVRAAAAFALGETESLKAADAILLGMKHPNAAIRAKAVEAAGKIAAANRTDERSKEIGRAILAELEAENSKGPKQDRSVVVFGLTAALRARPEKTDATVVKFLADKDARVRADAANTLSRIRAKNAGAELRAMLAKDPDPVARATAARALGSAEDKQALDLLLKAATADLDSRVRVAAIGALASLKEAKAAEPLLARAEILIGEYSASAFRRAGVQNELLELFSALGRLLPNTRNERAVNILREFGKRDNGYSPEAYIARVRIAPVRGDDTKPDMSNWRQYSTLAQVIGEFSAIEPTNDEGKKMKAEAPDVFRPMAKAFAAADPVVDAATIKAAPDVLRAFARFKTVDLAEILITALDNKDPFVRAAAAELLAELPPNRIAVEKLEKAFELSLRTDTEYNDAQLAILDALSKLDGKDIDGTLSAALDAPDGLVRKKAIDIIEAANAGKDLPFGGIAEGIIRAKLQLNPYPGKGTKMGQVLNSDADYRRAISRRNGAVNAVLQTEKGTFTIDLLPEDAPLTVDNFVKLAKSGYFNGVEVHRVVPNFVMQDGDPRGDGNGGPGWSIRCEMNTVPFDRGAVGMALSGKDTGGSQWFVTHSPQPHLDGGYTVFGRVKEADMKVVDSIVRGDKILTVKIVEGKQMRKPAR